MYIILQDRTNSGGMDRNSYDYQTLLKTIYGEARGEPELGQRAVAWVIYNRVQLNRNYWGGNTIASVCRAQYQFECWNGVSDIIMTETGARNAIDNWLLLVYLGSDPSFGSQYFNNPDKEGYPPWTNNVIRTVKIGAHQFYKE